MTMDLTDRCPAPARAMRAVVLAAALLLAAPAFAWGPEGHGVIGIIAVERMDPEPRDALRELLGGLDGDTVAQACNWPDSIRENPVWVNADPLHYVNLPAGEDRYDRDRDCPDGRCNPEAVLRFAEQLGNPVLLRETRWQAFAWLCHLVGDLHQPMHVGNAEDRGGNEVSITYVGVDDNLHWWWDGMLIAQHSRGRDRLVNQLMGNLPPQPHGRWRPSAVSAWTDESRALFLSSAYPPNGQITPAFEQQAWQITQQQLAQAGVRLAHVLNTLLNGDLGGPRFVP